jgi:hypothetical protein
MSRFCFVSVACALLAAGPVRAQENEARAIVEKAIKAHGGEDKLTKMKAVHSKTKGTLHIQGMELAMTEENRVQLPNRFRNETQLTVNNMNFNVVVVFNGQKGWVQAMGQTKELEGKALEALQQVIYAQGVGRMLFLKDKKYKLAPLGETKVNDKAAVGVLVTSKGRPDVNLHFDKESGLLLKMEYRVLDAMTEMEVAEERFFRDYKDKDGRKMPTRVEVHRDGKRFADVEIVEVRVVDGFDDSVFARPE